MKALSALEPLGLLALRSTLGVVFMVHGYPKLVHNGAGMQAFFTQHGLPGYFVYLAGILEVFGGGLLILGLFARVAGLLLALEMAVAIWKVHSSGGYLALHNYEFPLALAAGCFAIATVGTGMLSIDHLLSGRSRMPKAPKPKK